MRRTPPAIVVGSVALLLPVLLAALPILGAVGGWCVLFPSGEVKLPAGEAPEKFQCGNPILPMIMLAPVLAFVGIMLAPVLAFVGFLAGSLSSIGLFIVSMNLIGLFDGDGQLEGQAYRVDRLRRVKFVGATNRPRPPARW